MRRLSVAVVAGLAAVVLLAPPAGAHEELNPSVVVVGKPVFVYLSAANEGRNDIGSVAARVPAGLELGGVTREPAGWTAKREGAVVTWTGGPLSPGKFEEWGFELHGPDQPGSFTFKVTVRYADGDIHESDVPLTVSAPGTAVTTSSGPASTTTTAMTVTTAPASGDGDGGSAASGAGDASAGGDEGRANLALAVGGLGAALAVAALVLGARRSGGGLSPARAVAEEQDW
jgi:hypothetical protein